MDQSSDAYLCDIWSMLDTRMREKYQYGKESYVLWFGRMQLINLDADRAVFACENETKRGIIEKRFTDFISSAMEDVIGYAPDVEIVVDKRLAPVIIIEENAGAFSNRISCAEGGPEEKLRPHPLGTRSLAR